MKLVLFERDGESATYGVLTGEEVVSLEGVLDGDSPQDALQLLIDDFEQLRPGIDQAARAESRIPLHSVRLLAPVPWPGKILCTTAVYASGARTEAQQLLATLKSAQSVVGPGEAVRLPDVDPREWQFVPQATLGLVMRGPAKDVSAADWRRGVFGVTCAIDVMARGDQQFGRDYWLAKSDTLGPLGPCIVTFDEIPDLDALRVRSWQNGAPAQDFVIGDASHTIGKQIELATTVMTLHTGDVLTCGTAPEGQRPLADGDAVDVDIDFIGRLSVKVAAPTRSGV